MPSLLVIILIYKGHVDMSPFQTSPYTGLLFWYLFVTTHSRPAQISLVCLGLSHYKIILQICYYWSFVDKNSQCLLPRTVRTKEPISNRNSCKKKQTGQNKQFRLILLLIIDKKFILGQNSQALCLFLKTTVLQFMRNQANFH